MLEVLTEVEASAFRDLNRAMNRVQKETGKSAIASVVWAARAVCNAGKAQSKPGKKLRKIFHEPTTISGVKRYYVKKYKQTYGGGEKYTKLVLGLDKNQKSIRANPAALAVRTIQNRGLAKKVWGAMGARVYRAGGGYGKKIHRNARVVKRLQPNNPTIFLTNKLSYLEDAYPGITANAMAAGSRHLNQQLDRRIRNQYALTRDR